MLKNYRVLIASGIVLLLAVIAALVWYSPNRFAGEVMTAARNHDTLRLEQLIDFPAVAGGLKSDLKPIMAQALSQRIAASGLDVSGPLAARFDAVAQSAIDTAIGQMVDQTITPVALEQLADDKPIDVTALGRQSAPLDDIFPKNAAGTRFQLIRKYLAFSRFRYTLANNSGRSWVDIDLVRRGLVGWRVERVTPIFSLADVQGEGARPTASAGAEAVSSATPPPPPPPSDEAVASAAAPASADTGLPTQIGQCVTTQVKEVATRLEDTPGSGSAVNFTNGGYQVSYDQVPAVDAAQPGDVVRMCLVSVPRRCPAGDARGSQYLTTDLRTHLTWSLADSEHACGGA